MSVYSEMMQGFMDRLASVNGIEAPKFNDTGLCVLGDDSSSIMLQIFEERNQLVFLSPIAVVPSHGREVIFEEMLSLNYFWSSTAGVTIAYDREANELVAEYAELFSNLDVERFSVILENFNRVCEMLRTSFAELLKNLYDVENQRSEDSLNDDINFFIGE